MTYTERKKKHPNRPDNCLRCGMFEDCKSYKLGYKKLQAGKKNILVILETPSHLYDTRGKMKGRHVGDDLQGVCSTR